jgi:hypothetical protein
MDAVCACCSGVGPGGGGYRSRTLGWQLDCGKKRSSWNFDSVSVTVCYIRTKVKLHQTLSFQKELQLGLDDILSSRNRDTNRTFRCFEFNPRHQNLTIANLYQPIIGFFLAATRRSEYFGGNYCAEINKHPDVTWAT